MCNFLIEDSHDGIVCGIDEVGRGPLAGPVVAACVYIPQETRSLPFVENIKDSKKLSFNKLEELYQQIYKYCYVGIAEISPQEIDEINILQASLKAMRFAYLSLQRWPESDCCNLQDPGFQRDDTECFALIDGNRIPPHMPCPSEAVVKGDSKSKSIAAASIIAKVTRDRMMHQLAEKHSMYGWERNVGYPTKEHLDAIERYGVTSHHRQSFAPVKNFLLHGKVKPEAA